MSGFHPYPAMVADELAATLSERYVKPGYKVLDPFCGSGRLLVAGAKVPGEFVGIDVNPLACLITMAKTAVASPSTISDITEDIDHAQKRVLAGPLEFRERRKVEWFSEPVRAELGRIVTWINELRLDWPEKTVVAAALSAATRDASYSRKGRWKLHRLSPSARVTHTKSAWDCLRQRLQHYAAETSKDPPPQGRVSVTLGDVTKVPVASLLQSLPSSFDLVLTSPPYGDSTTTVQYGAASALCLEAVSRIDGFEEIYVPGRDIDYQCLGGSHHHATLPEFLVEIKPYWAGARSGTQATMVKFFFADFFEAFRRITPLLTTGGQAVMVLGRRSVGGFRVKLDIFAIDCLERLGLRLASYERRVLRGKRLPRTINRFGRARSTHLRAKGTTKTMTEEFILAFETTRRVD